ncbi:hypothetical protein [Coleofasciculus sp. F4-SAH-05]|uniref:hypothetical protein n=1 Tax=Coleofasciculus sp. F4-SAH-05 TaxID=3069525 RepID=UPI0032F9B664
MKAIVLTCDKNMFIVDHMIHTYQKFWYNNPFVFIVPYGKYAHNLHEKYGKKVELIETESEKLFYPIKTDKGTKKVSLIKKTVLSLLENIPDEEWIYWCIDDKYLIQIKPEKVIKLYLWIKNIQDLSISGICFCRGFPLANNQNLKLDSKIYSPDGEVFLERKNYEQIFCHQFVRAKVLKTLFATFPDRPFFPKEMDDFHRQVKIPNNQKLYVIKENNMVSFGESTIAGKLTLNCTLSFQKHRFEIPQNYEISDRRMIFGELPITLWGKKIVLPEYLKKNQHKFDGQYIKYKIKKLLAH